MIPQRNKLLAFFKYRIKMERKEVLSMKISLSLAGDTVKKHTKLCTIALTAVALLVGAVLGIVFERNIGISLSDRLARRIGTTAVTVESCVKSGPVLTVTMEFPYAPEKGSETTSEQVSKPQDWFRSDYYRALTATREELVSGPYSAGIERVTVVCRHGGKTVSTITGDRESKDASMPKNKSGKQIPPPFTDFKVDNADGSKEALTMIVFNKASSRPAG